MVFRFRDLWGVFLRVSPTLGMYLVSTRRSLKSKNLNYKLLILLILRLIEPYSNKKIQNLINTKIAKNHFLIHVHYGQKFVSCRSVQ